MTDRLVNWLTNWFSGRAVSSHLTHWLTNWMNNSLSLLVDILSDCLINYWLSDCQSVNGNGWYDATSWCVDVYRVIFKKVSFGIFIMILVSNGKKNYTMKSNDKVLSLSKLLWYLAIVKIIKIRHLKGPISKKNQYSKIVFM